MLNVALIGAGAHSSDNHGPALRHYVEQHPGRVRLAAVCDLDPERARKAQAAFGFARAVTAVEDLFVPGAERIDALIAILPIPVMLAATPPLLARGLPLLIEKPLGQNLREAERIGRAARAAGADRRVMVSLNRRHDPAVIRAVQWLQTQPPFRYVRASLFRNRRTESTFDWDTAVHVLDLLQHVAGPLAIRRGGLLCPGRRDPDGARLAILRGRDGADVVFEILPNAGEWKEELFVVGDEYQVELATGTCPPWRVRTVKNMNLVLDERSPAGEQGFVGNGAYGETAAFLDAVIEGRPMPAATLADALESSRLAARIAALK